MLIDAIVGHLVGDYLLQNDHMAMRKKSDWFVCAVHCFIWTSSVIAFGITIPGKPIASDYSAWIVPILFASHYIQDRGCLVRKWMSLAGQDNFASGALSPWSIVVVDNVLHIVTIYAVWHFFDL